MVQEKVIAIISNKGGVGKTFITAGLGTALVQEFGKKVLLLDTNKTMGLGLHLGVINNDTMKGTSIPNDSVYSHKSGVDITPGKPDMPNGLTKQEDTNSYEKLNGEMDPSKYDFLLMDAAPGLTEESMTAMKNAEALILVTNPEFPSIMACLKQIKIANDMEKNIIGVVLNRTNQGKYEMKRDKIESILNMPIIAEIPEDSKVQESISLKKSIIEHAPDSKASIALKELAGYIAGEPYMRRNLLSKIRGLFNREDQYQKRIRELEIEIERMKKTV
ncbi:MAG: P-loop NTPase [Candidatus Aenigmatarchaeota archaeon]